MRDRILYLLILYILGSIIIYSIKFLSLIANFL